MKEKIIFIGAFLILLIFVSGCTQEKPNEDGVAFEESEGTDLAMGNETEEPGTGPTPEYQSYDVGEDNSLNDTFQQTEPYEGLGIPPSQCDVSEDCFVYSCDCKCHQQGYEGPVCGIMDPNYCLDNFGIIGCDCVDGKCIEIKEFE